MDRIDRALSRRAQEFWHTALVICRNEGSGLESWLLHRHDLGTIPLGSSVEEARESLQGMLTASDA